MSRAHLVASAARAPADRFVTFAAEPSECCSDGNVCEETCLACGTTQWCALARSFAATRIRGIAWAELVL